MVPTADEVSGFLAAWAAAERHGSTTMGIARQTAPGDYPGNPLPEGMRAALVVDAGHGVPQLAGVHLSFLAGTPGAPPLPARPAQPETSRG